MPSYKKTVRNALTLSAALCVGGGVLFASHVTMAQTPSDLMSRLGRMENELQTLNRAVYKNDKQALGRIAEDQFASQGQVRAQTEIRLQQIERQISELRGLVEEQGHAVSTLTENVDRIKGDVEMRLSDLERAQSSQAVSGAQNIVPSASSTQKFATQVTAPASPSRDAKTPSASSALTQNDLSVSGGSDGAVSAFGSLPERTSTMGGASDDAAAKSYENAFALLKASQYKHAGAEFLTFLKQFPDHVLAGNAKYWLGETFYVRGDYERAARIFAEGYKTYPKSAKTADNLLKLALSLSALENVDDACVALDQLEQDFGQTSNPAAVRGRQELKKLKCA